MSERHAAFGEKLRKAYERRGTDINQIRLDAQLDAVLAKHNQMDFAANNMAMICINDRTLLKAAMMRLVGAYAEGMRKESGSDGPDPSAGNGLDGHASEPLTDDGDGGQPTGASDGHTRFAASPSPHGGGKGHTASAGNGHGLHAHPSPTQGDDRGHRSGAGDGLITSAPSSPLVRGAGATLGTPEGQGTIAPVAANPQREPSRATLAASHRAEMRAAKFILKLPDGRDITQIRLGEAAHYETKTAGEAVVNYVMKVLRRDYASFDPNKLLGSDDKGAVPMPSLQRLIREAQEAIYGKAA